MPSDGDTDGDTIGGDTSTPGDGDAPMVTPRDGDTQCW